MRNSERRIGLGIDPGMLGYRISPRCWTAHGRHWLPSSAQLNIEILPKLSNTSCFSNGGTGSRRVSVRLSWDMVSSPCLNWKLRSDTEMFLSRPIWISRWWLTNPISPHEMFRIACTANTNGGGDDTGLYQGAVRQNLALLDRYMACEVGYSNPSSKNGYRNNHKEAHLQQKIRMIQRLHKASFQEEKRNYETILRICSPKR